MFLQRIKLFTCLWCPISYSSRSSTVFPAKKRGPLVAPSPPAPLLYMLKWKTQIHLSPNPNRLIPSHSENVFFARHRPLISMSTVKIVAEYAKSSRSSCKGCSKVIPAKGLRLGIVSRHPRGFDTTHWHHLDCFPFRSQPIESAEEINGYSLLEENDRDALKKLEGLAAEEVPEADEAGTEEAEEVELKKSKVRKTDEVGTEKVEEMKLKKSKLLMPGKEPKIEIFFSVSEVKNKYKDATLLPKWKAFQTVIFREPDEGFSNSDKVAAFDFDGCLVNTSVKRIGADAWSLLYPTIPGKLQSLYNDGYKLVIFTNESNIERWKNKRQQAIDSKIGRLDNFIKLINVPIQVFIACGLGKGSGQTDDPFRKPNPGMWKLMEEQFNSGIAIDMNQSFYVGDAAGRIKDHSDADIKFAQAIGLKFYVPEEYFAA